MSRNTLDTLSVIFITLVLSYSTLIFGELVPKRIAMKKSEALALKVSGIVSGISVLFKPIVWLLSVFSLRGQNKVLWGAMIGSLILTTALLEIPFLADAFGFTPVGWTEYGIALGLAFLVIPIVEVVKFIQRRHAGQAI